MCVLQWGCSRVSSLYLCVCVMDCARFYLKKTKKNNNFLPVHSYVGRTDPRESARRGFSITTTKKSLNSVYMCVQISNVTKLTRSCTTLMNTFKISEPEVHIRRVRVHLYSLFVNLIRVSYVFSDKEIKHPCDLGIRVYIFKLLF